MKCNLAGPWIKHETSPTTVVRFHIPKRGLGAKPGYIYKSKDFYGYWLEKAQSWKDTRYLSDARARSDAHLKEIGFYLL